MLKPKILAQAIALALLVPGASYAELEVSGVAKIEYSLFTTDGTVTGASEAHDAGDAMKSEASVKLFINTDVGEKSSFHAELLLAAEGEAASDRLEGGEAYSQYEVLREFYFDTAAAGWDFRLGKQQVVWGTADGIKLLDIINPTDFRELNQNVSEDSRIPVWMINAEKYFDNGSSLQVLLYEAQPNFIAGLDADGDSGAPFVFKGVDTITGKRNGFLSVANDMGKTSGVFQTLLSMGGLSGAGGTSALSTGPMALTTVSGFTVLGTPNAPLTPDDGADFANGAHTMTFADVGAGLQGPGGTITAGPSTFAVFPGPVQADPNLALLNVVFLPFMSQLQTGNEVLNQASNTSGDLLNNFAGYMGQLSAGLQTGTADGAAFTNTASAVLDINGDNLADTNAINTALTELGSQMFAAVAGGMGLNPADPATVAAIATAFGINPPTATPTDPDTIAFNTAIQTAAITGMGQTFFSNSNSNQFSGTLDTANPTSAFDYMGNTTFGTFDAFIGMQTEYRKDYDTDPMSEQNLGFRFKNSTAGGTSYSLNFAYRYDANPYVDLHWENSTGSELSVRKNISSMDQLGQPRDTNFDGVVDGSDLNPNPEAYTVTTLQLMDGATAFDSQSGANPAKLVFVEKLNRVTTLGTSFDTALDGTAIPVIIRGEFSYDVGTKQPVIDLDELSIGNLTGALKMEDADVFKYVLGVDLTVMTNLLVSTQLIQMYNLDYIDEGNRYTGDFSSMHLTNGMNKGDEVETFVSFFLSKPYGSDGQHRWNNIIIAENGGGYWNRFDIEYGINDEMVGTIEYNKYWGDENTTFGQFENSSNLQLGFKYLF